MPAWEQDEVGPVALAALGQRYRRYRLSDVAAEEAMVGSLRRFGQQTPLVACRRPHVPVTGHQTGIRCRTGRQIIRDRL